MPAPLTMVTELGTGLGMLGLPSLDEALRRRPATMASVAPGTWDQLVELRRGGAFDAAFDGAFANGRAFLAASDGLRDRIPAVVEWKGSQRAPGDEVAPIDLRVDHVYLVSCKYLSKILCNASPAHLFDELLAGRHGRRSVDWYETVAPREHQALYETVRRAASSAGPPGPGARPAVDGRADGPGELPDRVADVGVPDRRHLARGLADGWPPEAAGPYAELARAVSEVSARRWREALERRGEHEAMLWRLLRMGSAPYFVLGATARDPLRLRIATPWDWRQRFRLRQLDVWAQEAGQPRVGWRAEVDDVVTARRTGVQGHVEVRWSHGRFGGTPEAKVYLDTPHPDVPGYFPLA